MAFTLATQPATVTRGNFGGARKEREPKPTDGVYLNVGLIIEVEGEQYFARLNRNITVSDLEVQKISARTYENNPSYAAQLKAANDAVHALHAAAIEMEPGEARPLKLASQMYKMETPAQNVPESTEADVAAVASDIFA